MVRRGFRNSNPQYPSPRLRYHRLDKDFHAGFVPVVSDGYFRFAIQFTSRTKGVLSSPKLLITNFFPSGYTS